MSVLEKAQQLTVQARTYSEGAKERDERKRVATALGEVARQLDELSSAVSAYVAARDVGVSLTAVAPSADLVTVPSGGLPSPQALVAARRRITEMAGRARDAVKVAWPEWSQAQLKAANTGRISRLGIGQRHRAEELQKRLLAAPATKQPTATQVSTFCSELAELERMLAGIREDDPTVLLLNRIRQGHTTLSDLTDDELAALRADDSVAGQVQLRTT